VGLSARAAAVLAQHFPDAPTLRDAQAPAIDAVLNDGASALCLMPTGSGKSLVYQVCGLALGGITVVVSPLVALMSQQVERLNRRAPGVAVSLSDLAPDAQYRCLRDLTAERGTRFLFVSPERLASEGYLEYVCRRARDVIGLVVIDEAHCISQWGHSFRPCYRAIPEWLDGVFGPDGWPRVLGLTATLNPGEEEDIRRAFRIPAAGVVRSAGLLRSNLRLACERVPNEDAKEERLATILAGHPDHKVIVYTHRKRSRHGARQLAERFRARDVLCDHYDADRTAEERRSVAARFEHGSLRVVFATSAFGMGVDIPDIRVVVHYLIPESIEQYYQEVGRAGRDGREAWGHLLFSDRNVEVRADLLRESVPRAEEIDAIFRAKLAAPTPGKSRSIDLDTDLSSDGREELVWSELRARGVIQLLGRGPRMVSSFAPAGRTPDPALAPILGVPSGLVSGAARRNDLPVATVIERLFEGFTAGRLKLVNAPTRATWYTSPPELAPGVAAGVAAALQQKLAVRQEGLQQLARMVTASGDPSAAVAAHLGVAVG
jgi:ATP-dependent DNA helicase RecQ